MPTFDDIFLEVFNAMTFGFVTDLRTAFVALVVLGFILFGSSKLFEIFQHRVASVSFQRASGYADMRDGYSSGTAGYDYYNSLYKQQLSQSVSLSNSDLPNKTVPIEPESSPTVFLDGSSPEIPSFSAESDWESASLAGEGYVGFAGSEVEDTEYADRSDWTLVQEPDITGLEVDSSSSFSSERSDWTAMQEADITGLEVDSSSSFSSERSDWTAIQEPDITGLEVDSSSSFSSERSDWTAMQEADITGLEVDSASSFSSERSDWTTFGNEEITGLGMESFYSSIDSPRSDWTTFGNEDITGLEVDSSSSFSSSDRSDWTSFGNEEITGLSMQDADRLSDDDLYEYLSYEVHSLGQKNERDRIALENDLDSIFSKYSKKNA